MTKEFYRDFLFSGIEYTLLSVWKIIHRQNAGITEEKLSDHLLEWNKHLCRVVSEKIEADIKVWICFLIWKGRQGDKTHQGSTFSVERKRHHSYNWDHKILVTPLVRLLWTLNVLVCALLQVLKSLGEGGKERQVVKIVIGSSDSCAIFNLPILLKWS